MSLPSAIIEYREKELTSIERLWLSFLPSNERNEWRQKVSNYLDKARNIRRELHVTSTHQSAWCLVLAQMQTSVFYNFLETPQSLAAKNLQDIDLLWKGAFDEFKEMMINILLSKDIDFYDLNDFKSAACLSKICMGIPYNIPYFEIDNLYDHVKQEWDVRNPPKKNLREERMSSKRNFECQREEKMDERKKIKKSYPPAQGEGKILSINRDKHFGFIKVTGDFENVYFHLSLAPTIEVGDFVQYTTDPRNATRAQTLEKIENKYEREKKKEEGEMKTGVKKNDDNSENEENEERKTDSYGTGRRIKKISDDDDSEEEEDEDDEKEK